MLLADVLSRATELTHQVLADGLEFGESPRFHEGKLYVSDMIGKRIYTIDESGTKEILFEVEKQPNGMCFMPDGSLIFSSMFDCRLHRYANGKSALFADLSSVMSGYCGDMVIDKSGRIYLDDVGSRVLHGEPRRPGRIIIVEPDGSFRVGAEDVGFPNGIAIDSSGKTLFISASSSKTLNTFDISETGELGNRREILDFTKFSDSKDRTACDGLCIDAEDGLWLSLLDFEVFVRRDIRGAITHVIRVEGHATACALGGPDGRTLYLVTNKITTDGQNLFQAMRDRDVQCTISVVRVEIPRGNGRP